MLTHTEQHLTTCLHTLDDADALEPSVAGHKAAKLAMLRQAGHPVPPGSMASHASIVAREHGIPAVVGTGCATTTIADGQRITVDGSRGVVRLSPEAISIHT